ncbi:MGDG synthase family glycosyltransferase [Rubritalea tangerina]|uniref:Diacylglycerol glucosyltransferase N-terminal domain-containing protein n=1 Tax=Rubritalea tangerina TaxID=430798 RepID=A0ABW4Z7M4_9BACT
MNASVIEATPPRVIITTAGFGEGHNSAANHLAVALEPKAEVEIVDPCDIGAPWVNHQLRNFYRFITTYAPKTWSRIYKSTDRHDFSKERLPLMRRPENALHEAILSFEPDAIISTYPLYPYFLERSFQRGARRVPVFTIITDSIEINSSWTKAPTDFWCVTDNLTRDKLIAQNLDPQKIIVTGFAVHPRFQNLPRITPDDSGSPFKVLYFPTSKKPTVRRFMRAILNACPDGRTEVTVVLGRNVRKLYDRAREIQLEFPGRVQIKGWTRRVPELLCNHHLIVGKAGGATVHEAIAAQTPMLIHHLVPGQEEGNLALLQEIGAGQLTENSKQVRHAIQHMMSDDLKSWRVMKQNLLSKALPCGANAAANFILNHLAKSQ